MQKFHDLGLLDSSYCFYFYRILFIYLYIYICEGAEHFQNIGLYISRFVGSVNDYAIGIQSFRSTPNKKLYPYDIGFGFVS